MATSSRNAASGSASSSNVSTEVRNLLRSVLQNMPRSIPSIDELAKAQTQQSTSYAVDSDMDIDVDAFQAGLHEETSEMPPPLPSEFADTLDMYLEHSDIISCSSDDEGGEQSDNEETINDFGMS